MVRPLAAHYACRNYLRACREWSDSSGAFPRQYCCTSDVLAVQLAGLLSPQQVQLTARFYIWQGAGIAETGMLSRFQHLL
jgi:hypothetical protein